ncbi:Wall-associated receptor kinase [Sesamum alatum]|uniref:Wall-associated receptor kinase n=1 Tax=Sesamum alatum TaxID=300844 RepID=A0AAE1XZR6_9LAMI|nr:Wall-associated receptor kinase [Sesamum alatum]
MFRPFPPIIGQHYSISQANNKFVAMGCDFFAYLFDEETRKVQGSCSSLCNPDDAVPVQLPSCSGLRCCEISFPQNLRNYTVSVRRMDYRTEYGENQCGFFTFVEKDFLSANKMKFSTCNESYVVPMIHEWAIGNTSCSKAREREDEYVCGQNTECNDYDPLKGYRCKCSKGYRGNPYLSQGCQDIDECANAKDNNCPEKTRCVNTEGSYFCLPNHRRMFELLIPLGTGLAVGLLILVAIDDPTAQTDWSSRQQRFHGQFRLTGAQGNKGSNFHGLAVRTLHCTLNPITQVQISVGPFQKLIKET